MKPAQLPIYRAVENLFLWLIPVTERLPKSLPFQSMGATLIRELNDCLDVIVVAHGLDKNSPNYEMARRDCFGVLVSRMTSIKTKMRVLQQTKIKVKDAQGKIKSAPIFSPKQVAKFLDLVNPIAIQAGAWLAAKPKQDSSQTPKVHD
ncbi:MAG: hypothetical protein NC548_36060 [Lachnospiraceae bacterium]|nr:hypothetical protein [Lachnospiraceae bacterium]